MSGPVGYFFVKTPFEWHEADGPMPIEIDAMLDHATPQPDYGGPQTGVTVRMSGLGVFKMLYGADKMPIPGAFTGPFSGGSWSGYALVGLGPDKNPRLGLACTDPVTGIGGSSLGFTWIVEAPPTDQSYVTFMDKGQVLWEGLRNKPVNPSVKVDGKIIFPS